MHSIRRWWNPSSSLERATKTDPAVTADAALRFVRHRHVDQGVGGPLRLSTGRGMRARRFASPTASRRCSPWSRRLCCWKWVRAMCCPRCFPGSAGRPQPCRDLIAGFGSRVFRSGLHVGGTRCVCGRTALSRIGARCIRSRLRRVPLPTYPFERKRYWIDAPPKDRGAPLPLPLSVAAADVVALAPVVSQDDTAMTQQNTRIESSVPPLRRS